MINEERNYFIVQTSSGLAEHKLETLRDRTFFEEVAKHLYYRYDNWYRRKPEKEDLKNIKKGDYIIQYCTRDVEEAPGQLKYIYEVEGLEKIPDEIIKKAVEGGRIDKSEAEEIRKLPFHKILLKKVGELRGLDVQKIRELVEEGKFSRKMGRVGLTGFNIWQIEKSDYELICKLDKEISPPQPQPVEIRYEEDLRGYLATRPLSETLGKVFPQFSTYELFMDEEGNYGELYETEVGQIDLLYRDSNSGNFLVIELKKTEETPDYVVGQIARYMGWVKKHLCKGKEVFGIIVAQGVSEKLKYAVTMMKNCYLAEFELRFEFQSIEPIT